MSISSTTVRNKTKIKIVLLGDQNVGKTSLIERYIHDRFDDSQNVPKLLCSQLLESILLSLIPFAMEKIIVYSFGIQQDKKDSKVSFPAT